MEQDVESVELKVFLALEFTDIVGIVRDTLPVDGILLVFSLAGKLVLKRELLHVVEGEYLSAWEDQIAAGKYHHGLKGSALDVISIVAFHQVVIDLVPAELFYSGIEERHFGFFLLQKDFFEEAALFLRTVVRLALNRFRVQKLVEIDVCNFHSNALPISDKVIITCPKNTPNILLYGVIILPSGGNSRVHIFEYYRGIIVMKWPIKRFGAAVMAALFGVSMLAGGCTAKTGGSAIVDESGLVLSGKMPDELPEGMSWYDFKEDDGIFQYLTEEFGECFISDITWFSGRTWMFIIETEPSLPVYHIMSFDDDNKPVSDFVIENEFGDNISLNRMVRGNGLYLTAYDFATMSDYIYPIDENTGSVTPDNKIDLSKNLSSNAAGVAIAFVGDDIAVLQNGDVPSVQLVGINEVGVKKEVSLDDLSKNFHIKYPEGILCGGKDKVVVWGATSANMYFGQMRYCLVDLTTGEISALDEMEYITVPLRNLSYCNGNLVTVTDGGVYTIDTDEGTCKMTLSFNCSNCNRFLVNNSELAYADEDRFVFSYSSRFAGYNQMNNAICTFTKSSEYPAAGKDIITVASTEDLDYSISEAMMIFNSTSSTSFLLFDSRYKANTDIDYSNADNTDRAAVSALNSYASVSDRLAMDIINGEGPDILITNGANEQLSKEDYFVDLTDFLANESGINESDYFMNAIEALKFNGALYQLPIGFYVDGFMGPAEAFGGKNGLTFEEYAAMVSDYCNGQDPIYDHQLTYSRTELATKLFANTNEMYINDGKIDVNSESFMAILDYCRDLPTKGYFEGKDIDAEFEDLMSARESMVVQPVVVYGFYEYETFATRFEDVTICGYPSIDGRTATIGSNIAVSVSAHSSNIDSCKEFLRVLLSEDVQNTIESNIPINKNCAKNLALKEIDTHNFYVDKNAGNVYAKSGEYIDPEVADKYIEELSTATTSSFTYHSISLIIYEEIPAYFEGQKSFEEVAEVINDRAQTVLDERE